MIREATCKGIPTVPGDVPREYDNQTQPWHLQLRYNQRGINNDPETDNYVDLTVNETCHKYFNWGGLKYGEAGIGGICLMQNVKKRGTGQHKLAPNIPFPHVWGRDEQLT